MCKTFLLRLPLLFAAAFLAGGCDSSTVAELRQLDAIRIVSGDGQTATVAQRLAAPLVVRVVDRRGRPVPGRVVGFIARGGGSVAPQSTATDADGVASAWWTLGTRTAEIHEVHVVDGGAVRRGGAGRGAIAEDGGEAPRAAAVFRARALPDLPERVAPVGDSACAGAVGMPMGDSLAVQVMDRHGNPVPGVPLAWRVMAGGGSVSPGSSTTGNDGTARALWTLGTRMDSAQVAEAAAGPALRTEFVARAVVGVGVVLVKLSGDGQAAVAGTPLAVPLRVRLQFADGRPVVGAPVSWEGPSASVFTPPASVTDENGEAAAEWTLGLTTGAVAATVRVAGIEPAVFTASALEVPVIFWGNLRVIGSVNWEYPVQVLALDRYSRPIARLPVHWQASRGSISPAVSVTDTNGVASAQWTFGVTGPAYAYATAEGTSVRAGIPGYAVGRLDWYGDGQTGTPGSVVQVSVETTASSELWLPVVGALVRWEVVGGGGSVASAASYTQETSRSIHSMTPWEAVFTARASMLWTLGPAGPQTLRASLGSLQVTFTATSVAPTGGG